MVQEIKKSKILIVEDEKIVAIDLKGTFKRLDYKVMAAVPSGEEALAFLEQQRVDLVVMDIQLAGEIDGIETARQIWSRYQIPFIYLSVFSDNETLARAKKTRPYGYITKSVDINDLHSTIEMALYRHRAERKAAEKEALLSLTLKSISDAVIGTDLDGIVMSWNRGASDILGYKSSEMKGRPLSATVPPFLPNELPEVFDRARAGIETDYYETLRVTKSGAIISMALKATPIKGPRSRIKGVSIIGRDITAQKNLEKEVLEIGEREKQRIGQDLHDSLGQQLTGISLRLKALTNQMDQNDLPREVGQLQEINEEIRGAILQTRELARGLIPVTLRSEGLSMALRELASNTMGLTNLTVECCLEEQSDIEDEASAMQLYRIAQEAVNNAVKHSRASFLTIRLYMDVSEMVLEVEDDGVGIVPSESRGIGLNIMRYRAGMINARISFHEGVDRGTLVKCRLPIPDTREVESEKTHCRH